MDFNQFDSRAAADKPRDLHLRHPVSGELLYDDGKPCIAEILGAESPRVQSALKALARAKVKGDALETHDDLVALAAPLIVGFRNVNRGDKPATAADAAWLLGLQIPNGQDGQASFVEQVSQFATDRGNFLGNVSAA
jgi:hypothetical protein